MDDRTGSGKDLSRVVKSDVDSSLREFAPTLADVFAALGDANRYRIVERLATYGEASATTLAAPLDVTRQAVDKHLGVLERAGLVSSSKHGRQVLYALRTEEFKGPAVWLNRVATNWERRLEAIKRTAEDA